MADASTTEAKVELASPEPFSDAELSAIHSLVWAEGLTAEDVQRWYSQGVGFDETLAFGLRQHHGGPCGMLASFQAILLRHLIFGGPNAATNWKKPSSEEREAALGLALGDIFWAIGGEKKRVIIVELSKEVPQSFELRRDSPTSSFRKLTLNDKDKVVEYFKSNQQKYDCPWGIILLLFSGIMTRGVEEIKDDMDESDNPLVARFGHCSQELLNLFLCGRAHTNTFDGYVLPFFLRFNE